MKNYGLAAIISTILIPLAAVSIECGTKQNSQDVRYVCQGTLATCLRIADGWQFEGQVVDNANNALSDASVAT